MRSRNRRTSWKHAAAGAVAALCVGLAPTLVAVAPPAGATSVATPAAGGSVDEAWLTGAGAGDSVTLVQNGIPVINPGNPGTADALGSLIIRNLTPGSGYAWDDTTTGATTPTFSVLAPGANPATGSALYTGQPLHEGLNYITMRDGIQLAATVRYPYGSTCSATAPCPTVIEYSGYGTAGPTDPIPYLLSQALHGPCTGCGDPNLLPDSVHRRRRRARPGGRVSPPSASRCGGRAARAAPTTSSATRPTTTPTTPSRSWPTRTGWPTTRSAWWASATRDCPQLPSAGTDPPDLAAIAPMSPTDDLFSTGYPGGHLQRRLRRRLDRRADRRRQAGRRPRAAARWCRCRPRRCPASASRGSTTRSTPSWPPAAGLVDLPGQPGAPRPVREPVVPRRAPAGGAGHRAGPGPVAVRPPFHEPVGDPHHRAGVRVRRPAGRADRARSGRRCSTPCPSRRRVFANMVNGGHIDSTDPQIISRWLEFLDIYVADKVPTAPTALAGLILDQFTSFAAGDLGPGPAAGHPLHRGGQRAAARAAVRQADPAGARCSSTTVPARSAPGDPQSTYSAGFAQWPPAGRTTSLLLRRRRGARRRLGTGRRRAAPSLRLDPTRAPGHQPARRAATPGRRTRGWDWTPVPAADGVAFQTAPFTSGHHHRRSGHPRPVGEPRPRRSRTSRPRSPRSAPAPARRSTSPRDSCAARTRSTCRRRPRCSRSRRYLAADAAVAVADARTRWSRSRSTRSSTPSGPGPSCGS